MAKKKRKQNKGAAQRRVSPGGQAQQGAVRRGEPQVRRGGPQVHLSQCMIVKNEERNIKKALSWGKGIVCEQIVVDTGSTDRTVEIAELMGAKVLHFEWVNDFAAAKNFAIEQATGDWIAFLDADEYFPQNDAVRLLPILEQIKADPMMNSKYLAISCPMHQLNDEGKTTDINMQVRLFRNIEQVRYRGRIHEELSIGAPDITRTEDIKIMHTGYSESAFRQTDKTTRNIEMLRAELARDPGSLRYKLYLADSLMSAFSVADEKEASDSNAEAFFLEAEGLYFEVARGKGMVDDEYRKVAYRNLLRICIHKKGGIDDRYRQLCESAMQDFPNDPQIAELQAQLTHAKDSQGETVHSPNGSRSETMRSQFEQEAAVLVQLIREMIAAGQLNEAGQLLGQYALLNPADPQIPELRAALEKTNAASDKTSAAAHAAPEASAAAQRPKFLENVESIYIVTDLSMKRTGVFTSIFGKVKLMKERLDYNSTILTCRHNIDLRKIEVWLKTFSGSSEVISPDIVIKSVYEHYQKSYAPGLENKAVFSRGSEYDGLRYERMSEKTLAVYDGDALVRLDVYTGYSGSLRVERHYEDGVAKKEIYYDDWGYINNVRELAPNDVDTFTAKYFATDGKLCLEAYFDGEKDKFEPQKITLFDDNGKVAAEFKNNDELAALYLTELMGGDAAAPVAPPNKFHLLVFESGTVSAIAEKLNYRNKNFAALTVIHSIFLKNAYNPASGPQYYYEYVCKNPEKFDGIVLLTKGARRDFNKMYGQHKNTFVVPHPYPFDIQPVPFEQRDNRKAVAIARLFGEKQIGVMVDIFNAVISKLPDVKFEIYGMGPEKEAIEQKIKKLGLENNIFLMGYTDDAIAVYRTAVMSIMTSIAEGYGLVLVESICNGCPAFSHDIKYGPSDIIEDGKTGFLFPRHDITKFAMRIIDYFKNEQLQRQMSENCYAAADRFSRERFLNNWLGMVETVVSRVGS